MSLVIHFVQGECGVNQAVAFAASVADFAGNDETLLVKLDGLARLPQVGVREAKIAEGGVFAAQVAELAEENQRPLGRK